MAEEAMKRLTITLPEDLILALEDMAEETDTSVSDAIREVIRSYLINNAWKGIARWPGGDTRGQDERGGLG